MKLIKNRLCTNNPNNLRMSQLETEIKKLYWNLSTKELSLFAKTHSKLMTLMIEIIDIRHGNSLIMALKEELTFKPALIPKELSPLLRPHDMFLATLGFKKGQWNIIYLSLPYNEGFQERKESVSLCRTREKKQAS